ncbi:twin-arginine translocation pathway signal protein [Sphingomonas sp. Root50]|nr:twin-arginine translocation pathway signal protein [Sphingomonas sp. Root1294]KQY72371.1 twin-arginine translocation pathway signal protein [Sphingomonas sp. Root50]KRB95488.1 twin-arginine translocation pathway signal protein [Sphingomonas sp. Root720]
MQGRRAFLLSSAATAAAFFTGPSIAVSPRQPNILFILADDLGYADLSCYGRRDYQTPAIDSLATHGMRFTQAYANSAVCSATRVSLITGRYQYRLPVGLEEPLGPGNIGLPPEHPTLPSLLRKAGYTTALIGKWHLGALPDFDPGRSGYDHFWGIRGGAVDYFTHKAMGAPDLWDDQHQIRQQGYLTDLLGDKAVEFIGEHSRSAKPWFMSLHFTAPHWPWEGPADEAEARRLDESRSPWAIAHYDGGSSKTYAQMVTGMDRQIARLIAALKRLDLEKDTIVVFTSDNGGERFSDTWPFSGRKTELLEGGLRIPAIIRWPGRIGEGAISDQMMASMDWLPTLLAIAGTKPDPAYPPDGMDLSPILAGSSPASRRLYWRYLNMNQEACRSGAWKYLKILDNSFLFNVVDDPLERANLKERYPEKFAELKAAFDSWNKTMLPLNLAARTGGSTGAEVADRFGVSERRNLLPTSKD